MERKSRAGRPDRQLGVGSGDSDGAGQIRAYTASDFEPGTYGGSEYCDPIAHGRCKYRDPTRPGTHCDADCHDRVDPRRSRPLLI